MKTSLKQKSSPWSVSLVLAVSLVLGACGGSDDSPPSPAPDSESPPPPVAEINPFAYPTKQDEYESEYGDDSLVTARTIAIGESQDRTIWPARDVDWIKVELVGGTDYEFSSSKLCATCDTYMYLYDANGILLDDNDDWIDYDSMIQFTPPRDGVYYIKVSAYDETYGVAHYTLGARILIDVDVDTYSTYYDCNDNDDRIYPDATDTPADGIDSDCSGIDWPEGSMADGAEEDDSIENAVPMYVAEGHPGEYFWQQPMINANTRTIHDTGVDGIYDIDFFSVTVPPYSASSYETVKGNVTLTNKLYRADGVGIPWTYILKNDTASPKIFYISFEARTAGNTGYYVRTVSSLGVDMDGDGYYTQDWDSKRDCNDADEAINPDATEQRGDGIDSNCDGNDNY